MTGTQTQTQTLVVDLAAPVASSDPYIHLDSFLSYAAGIEAIGYDGIQSLDDGGDPEYFEDEMPLEKIEYKDDWVWNCSAAMVAKPDEYCDEEGNWNTTRWRKRFDVDLDHQVKRTHVNTSSGEFKSYNAALPYNAADKLFFYLKGDGERAKEMIEEHIPGIGKKTSQGFGAIKDVHLGDAEADNAVHYDGRILRSIPADWITPEPGTTFQRRTTKPPYWHQANQTMAVRPFEEVSVDNLQFLDRIAAETLRAD